MKIPVEINSEVKWHHRVVSVVLFTVIVLLLITLLFKFYYSFVPVGYFIKVYDFSAPNINVTNETYQTLYFQRQVKFDIPGEVQKKLTLYNVETHGEVAVYKLQDFVFFEQGYKNLTIRTDFPDNVEEGTYYWEFSYTISLPENVKRSFVIQTNQFNVSK